MNISEFLNGEELTIYANKRFEKVNENMSGKIKLLATVLSPLGALIFLDKVTGTGMLSTSIITILSLIYLGIAVSFANTEFRKLIKKDKVKQLELEELAQESSKIEFLHENIPFKPLEIKRFENTLSTISLYRENVTCEKVELNLDSLIVFEGHKVFENILFTDNSTNEQFLVGVSDDAEGNVKYYSEYKVVDDILDQTNVVLKTVEKDNKSITIKN